MDEAVSHGIKSTAGVVTSAALVMVAVFSVFATLSMLFFKQFGVGLAVAVLIDATIVRAVLLPATMKLLGEWNWYLPRWLEWLPRLERRAEHRSEPGAASCEAREHDPAPPVGAEVSLSASYLGRRRDRRAVRARIRPARRGACVRCLLASRHALDDERTPMQPRRHELHARADRRPRRSSRSLSPASRTSASRPTTARSPCPKGAQAGQLTLAAAATTRPRTAATPPTAGRSSCPRTGPTRSRG